MQIEIPEAVSEKLEVRYKVEVKTSLANYNGDEFAVTRSHDEFEWLFQSLVDNPLYAGCVIPPVPQRADIAETRVKFARLDELEGSMKPVEFARLKEQVVDEYTLIFKKTVREHEHFLQRVVEHDTMQIDHDLRIFLTFDDELGVRGRNTSEKIMDFFTSITKAADEVSLLQQDDPDDDFFQSKKKFILSYLDSVLKTYEAGLEHLFKSSLICQDIISVVYCLNSLGRHERKYPVDHAFVHFLHSIESNLESMKKYESRQISEIDVHFVQVLRYHSEEMKSAKNALVRRARARVNDDKAQRELDRAKYTGKNLQQATQNAEVYFLLSWINVLLSLTTKYNHKKLKSCAKTYNKIKTDCNDELRKLGKGNYFIRTSLFFFCIENRKLC